MFGSRLRDRSDRVAEAERGTPMYETIIGEFLNEWGVSRVLNATLLAIAGASVIFVICLNTLPDKQKYLDEEEI